jgi:hypothetical protein
MLDSRRPALFGLVPPFRHSGRVAGAKKIAIKPIDNKNGIIYNFDMGAESTFYFLPK